MKKILIICLLALSVSFYAKAQINSTADRWVNAATAMYGNWTAAMVNTFGPIYVPYDGVWSLRIRITGLSNTSGYLKFHQNDAATGTFVRRQVWYASAWTDSIACNAAIMDIIITGTDNSLNYWELIWTGPASTTGVLTSTLTLSKRSNNR